MGSEEAARGSEEVESEQVASRAQGSKERRKRLAHQWGARCDEQEQMVEAIERHPS
jgi:hypothetical protein